MTTKELLDCAERELALRRRVYPNFVLRQSMSQAKADHEIAAMGEIRDLLRSRLDVENPQLFPENQTQKTT